jgi:hypothetical protein
MPEGKMGNIHTLGLAVVFVLLGGCAPHFTANNNDEQVDLYLSTLDDKHFTWCELDLEQCRHDFEQWKRTPRGARIIEAFEQEDTGQTDESRHLPNVFRTRFVDESRFPEQVVGEHGKGQDFSQDTVEIGPLLPSIYEDGHTLQEGKSADPRILDPLFAP